MNAITIEEAERLVKTIHRRYATEAEYYMWGFNNAVRIIQESKRKCGYCGTEQKKINCRCVKCDCILEE